MPTARRTDVAGAGKLKADVLEAPFFLDLDGF